MLRNLTIFLIVLFLGNFFCAAQIDRGNAEPIGLVLEISYDRENKPAYIYVTDHILQSRGNLFSNFQRVANWRQPENSVPVKAVKIVSLPERNAVKLKVSVLAGQKPYENEQAVAEYTLRENEKITVSNLTKFGIEPFEIRAAAVILGASELPLVVNKTDSLTVEKFEPVNSENSSLRLVLANNSDKTVSTLVYKVSVGKSLRSSGRPENSDGKILIKPGEKFQAIIPNVGFGVRNSAGQTVSIEPEKMITISAVVFEDGSFEGEEAEAARFLIVKFGKKTQLKKILALLEQNDEADFSLDKLRARAENLSDEIAEADLDKFLSQFAALPDNEKFYLRSAANAIFKDIKGEFVADFESLNEEGKKIESAKAQSRLISIREKYRNLLSKLD